MNREQVERIVDAVLEGWDEKEHPRDKDGKFSGGGYADQAAKSFEDSGEKEEMMGLYKSNNAMFRAKVMSRLITQHMESPDAGKRVDFGDVDEIGKGMMKRWKGKKG